MRNDDNDDVPTKPWYVIVMHSAVVGIYSKLSLIPDHELRAWTSYIRSEAKVYAVDIWLPKPQLGSHVRPDSLGWTEIQLDGIR